jgi:hypothetical protein
MDPNAPPGEPGVPTGVSAGAPAQGLTPGAPLPAAQNPDAAGNPSQGQATRLFPQKSVPQQRT